MTATEIKLTRIARNADRLTLLRAAGISTGHLQSRLTVEKIALTNGPPAYRLIAGGECSGALGTSGREAEATLRAMAPA